MYKLRKKNQGVNVFVLLNNPHRAAAALWRAALASV